MAKAKKLLFAASFVPVIVFKLLLKLHPAGPDPAKLASVAGLSLALAHLAVKRAASQELTHLEKAFIAYLAFFSVCAFMPGGDWRLAALAHPISILYAVLFVMASVPQMLGFEPFTNAIARGRQPESVWGTPQFRAINRRISAFFAAIFLISAISAFFGGESPVFAVAIPLALIFGAGVPFAARYPARYLEKSLGVPPQEPISR